MTDRSESGPSLSPRDVNPLPVLPQPFSVMSDSSTSSASAAGPPVILVTGGAGFIGANFLRLLLGVSSFEDPAHSPAEVRVEGPRVLNLDALTYAGNPATVAALEGHPRSTFIQGDITDAALLGRIFAEHPITAVVHFAAESHVDRSIDRPEDFLLTNVLGTFRLLEAARRHWMSLPAAQADAFRFLHVSTDEVYGTLRPQDPAFTEETAFAPNSPYAASKAASDHFARAYFHTYGLPVLTTNCSNNYGPWQFPEKLIPLMILNALEGKALPIYGDGGNVRDWLFVEDHGRAIREVLAHGRPGETYNVGGRHERTNLEIVDTLCATLDRISPRRDGRSYLEQKTFVADRPGHDRRYAVDASKIERELGWTPQESFETGLEKTIRWYLQNRAWCDTVAAAKYQGRQRLGLG